MGRLQISSHAQTIVWIWNIEHRFKNQRLSFQNKFYYYYQQVGFGDSAVQGEVFLSKIWEIGDKTGKSEKLTKKHEIGRLQIAS